MFDCPVLLCVCELRKDNQVIARNHVECVLMLFAGLFVPKAIIMRDVPRSCLQRVFVMFWFADFAAGLSHESTTSYSILQLLTTRKASTK